MSDPSKEIVIEASVSEALIAFHPTEAQLVLLRDSCKEISMATHGEAAVAEARKACKAHRVKIEAKRKELKADALEYGRRVDAKRLFDIIAPTEARLQAEEDALEQQREAERKEAARRKVEQTQRRFEQARALGITVSLMDCDALNPGAWQALIDEGTKAKAARDEEARLLAQERIKREEEDAALRAHEAELQRQEREREREEAAALRADNERLRAEAEAKKPAPMPLEGKLVEWAAPSKESMVAGEPRLCPTCGQAWVVAQ
jgi:hypothetical protein